MRRATIGFVFQFFALIPTLTAYENIEMPLLLNGKAAGRATGAGPTRCSKRSAWPTAPTTARTNSAAGEQQRVAVARALATKPSLILADEPTANLDTANGKQVMEIMQRLNKETGVTFVFATHDPRVVKFARRVVTLQDGLVVNHNAPARKA